MRDVSVFSSHGGLTPSHPPPFWIPAFAGKTSLGVGVTSREAIPDRSPEPACVAIAHPRPALAREGMKMALVVDSVSASLVPPLPPLWIPAFAGMTK